MLGCVWGVTVVCAGAGTHRGPARGTCAERPHGMWQRRPLTSCTIVNHCIITALTAPRSE